MGQTPILKLEPTPDQEEARERLIAWVEGIHLFAQMGQLKYKSIEGISMGLIMRGKRNPTDEEIEISLMAEFEADQFLADVMAVLGVTEADLDLEEDLGLTDVLDGARALGGDIPEG